LIETVGWREGWLSTAEAISVKRFDLVGGGKCGTEGDGRVSGGMRVVGGGRRAAGGGLLGLGGFDASLLQVVQAVCHNLRIQI
jgi:hypothetical protein